MSVDAVTRRIRAEFEEMPGLVLTERQAARLFGVEPHVCRSVIDQLIDAEYLRKTRGGAIARAGR